MAQNLLATVLFISLLLTNGACSNDKPQRALTPTQSRVDGLFATITAIAAKTPVTPAPTPIDTVLGTSERVWVYADSAIVPQACLDLLPDMIPDTAPASV